MEEKWKDVFGYEGVYSISSYGRIRSHRKNIQLKTFVSNSGYERVEFNFKGIKKFSVHRLVCMAFIGKPGKKHVNHIDRNKLNNRLENLEYVTIKYNAIHRLSKKRGVSASNSSSFRARIWNNDHMEHVGTFKNKEEAYSAYRERFYEIHGVYPW